MSCNVQDFKLDAVCIEIQDINLHLNVQDTFGSVVENASVAIVCNGNTETGNTDEDGNYYTVVIPSVTCAITITKDCLDTFTGSFVLLNDTDINDVSSNFPLKVTDASGNAIANANVSITTLGTTVSGTTDSNGLYRGINKNDYDNTIVVSKAGYLSVTAVIRPFIKVDSILTGYHAVPVITLSI
jgi:hypothetical protein